MNTELNELKQLLQGVQREKQSFIEGGGTDQVFIAGLNNQINAIQQQISAMEMQGTVETLTATVADPNHELIITAGGMTLNFRDLPLDERQYQYLKMIVLLEQQEREIGHSLEINALESVYNQELDQKTEEMLKTVGELQQARDELGDVRGRLEIAANTITDLENGNTSKDSEIESLRKQVEELKAAVKKEDKPTNLNFDSALIKAQFEESKPLIYDVIEVNGTQSTAKLLETDEKVTFHPFYIGRYRVATNEQVSQFRQEREAAEQAALEAMESTPDVDAVDDVGEDFREQANIPVPELQDTTAGLAQESSDMAGETQETVTRAEFEALRHEVTMIAVELKARSILPHNWEAA